MKKDEIPKIVVVNTKRQYIIKRPWKKQMKKDIYILEKFKKKYPKEYKDLELDYMIEETNKVLQQHNFKKFLESLNKNDYF